MRHVLNIMNRCCTILFTIAFAIRLGNVIVSSTENVASADDLGQRRELLRNMTKHVWQGYMKDVLNASSATYSPSIQVKTQIILHILTSLWTMEMKEEFAQGRELINANFGNLSQKYAREHMNDFAGALLSCYALTNDTMFRDKAFELASTLPNYDNQTGLANSIFAPKTHEPSKVYGLSDFGGIMLEERYLHSLAPEQFVDRTSLWMAFLRNQTNSNTDALFSGYNSNTGIYSGINSTTHSFSGDTRSLTSFYSQWFYANLVKRYAQSNGTDLEAIELFVKAIETAVQLGMISTVNGLSYIRDHRIDMNQFDSFMHYRGCVYGALLWIGADALEAIREQNQTIASKTNKQLNETITQYRKIARQITETCHSVANQTPAKLLPARLYINQQDRVANNPKDSRSSSYKYDSGLEESYFVLWRATKEQEYRDYAWELTQAYKRGDKADWYYELYSHGFKYLYLTFSDDSLLPLDQWVFTHKGHPLPICGRNGANPKC